MVAVKCHLVENHPRLTGYTQLLLGIQTKGVKIVHRRSLPFLPAVVSLPGPTGLLSSPERLVGFQLFTGQMSFSLALFPLSTFAF